MWSDPWPCRPHGHLSASAVHGQEQWLLGGRPLQPTGPATVPWEGQQLTPSHAPLVHIDRQGHSLLDGHSDSGRRRGSRIRWLRF